MASVACCKIEVLRETRRRVSLHALYLVLHNCDIKQSSHKYVQHISLVTQVRERSAKTRTTVSDHCDYYKIKHFVLTDSLKL